MKPPPPAFPDRDEPSAVMRLSDMSAAAIWSTVAADLDRAAASARHPLHLVTVATVDATGAPHARTVVVRGFDAHLREVRFHTDVRSPKVEQIGIDGRVALHWYDPLRRLQLRIAARAALHHGDAVARAAWDASPAMSRACYTTADAPGTHLDACPPAPAAPAATDDGGLASFAVVRCRFDAVEVLALHASGHERIRLRFTDAEPRLEILAP
jgi:pyridoxamine 5'-phosphate oxidase